MSCVHSKRDWSAVICGTCSLMVGCLLIGLMFLSWGASDLFFLVATTYVVELWKFAPFLIFMILKLSLGLIALGNVCRSNACVIACLAASYKVCISALTASYIVRAALWIRSSLETPKWELSSLDTAEIIVETLFTFTMLVTSYWAMSVLRSFHRVLAADGTGWEKLNYKEIKLARARLARQHFDHV